MQLILIHGFGCSAGDWSAQLEPLGLLADVVAVELPIHRDAQPAAGSLIVEMAEAVNDGRRASALPDAVLVGHSMGCRIALEAARRLPTAVKGLVLIEGSLRAVGDAAEAVRRYQSRSADENKALLMREFAGMFSEATPGVFRKLVLQRAEEMSSECAAKLMADMTHWDAAEAAGALRSVRSSILVLQSTYKEPGGERRPIGAQEMSPWIRMINEQTARRSEVVRLQGLGHFPHVEAPTTINDLIVSFGRRLKPQP